MGDAPCVCYARRQNYALRNRLLRADALPLFATRICEALITSGGRLSFRAESPGRGSTLGMGAATQSHGFARIAAGADVAPATSFRRWLSGAFLYRGYWVPGGACNLRLSVGAPLWRSEIPVWADSAALRRAAGEWHGRNRRRCSGAELYAGDMYKNIWRRAHSVRRTYGRRKANGAPGGGRVFPAHARYTATRSL